MYVDYSKNFCFIHNPRTGGTSILEYLDSVFDLTLQLGEHEIMAKLYPEKLKHSVIANDFFKCGFVRNPWDRLHSAYTYLMRGGINFDDARVSNIFIDPFRGDFNSFVHSYETWFGAYCDFLPNSYKTSPHFQAQHKFFYYDGNMVPNFLGRFENYESDLKNMLYVYSCDNLSPTDGADFLQSIPSEVPIKNTADESRENYITAYDSRSVDIVSELYATDISLFNYSFDG